MKEKAISPSVRCLLYQLFHAISKLTVVDVARRQRAVLVRRAKRSVLAVLVVAARKDAVLVLGRGGRIRGQTRAGEDVAPAGPGEDGGGDVVRRDVDQRGRAADSGHLGRDGLDWRALVADGDPGSGWICSRLKVCATVHLHMHLQVQLRLGGGLGHCGGGTAEGGCGAEDRDGMHRGVLMLLISLLFFQNTSMKSKTSTCRRVERWCGPRQGEIISLAPSS